MDTISTEAPSSPPLNAAGSSPAPLPEGVYFSLPHEQYLADPALGSSSLKQLTYDPAAYWYNSPHNPAYVAPKPTAPQLLGTAFHTMVLDGPEAFKNKYIMEPSPEYLRTVADITDWIKVRGGAKIPRAKRDVIAMAREIDPEVKIYDVAVEAARTAGKEILSEGEYTRIVRATEAILANPALRPAIAGGVAEVSVFWTEEHDGMPVRLKARFDYLKPRAVVDLKSMRPTFGRTFLRECLRAVANFSYHVQAQSYLNGRAAFAGLAKRGKVYAPAGVKIDEEWLARVCEQTEFAFVFVFWASDGAPLTWGGSLSPGNPVLDIGAVEIQRALAAYTRCSKKFEPGTPWLEFSDLGEIDISELPNWFAR